MTLPGGDFRCERAFCSIKVRYCFYLILQMFYDDLWPLTLGNVTCRTSQNIGARRHAEHRSYLQVQIWKLEHQSFIIRSVETDQSERKFIAASK